jgi:glycosyltransferase involved in cell wall biosynthesis
MLEGASIICFGNDWDTDPVSNTHIMRILAAKNRVLWVNSLGMRRPTLSGRDLGRMATKLRRGLAGCTEVRPNLFVVSPLVLPLPGMAFVNWLNAALLAPALRFLCRRHGLHRPILWAFQPYVSRLIGRLDERMVIYHCCDENSAFHGVPEDALREMERHLVRHADIVFTSAAQLGDERRPLNPDTHYVPHGVDVSHFARALDPGTVVPADLSALRGPVIGFFGLISDDWVDLTLLREMALARPGWQFVLIGKVSMDLRPLQGFPNVHVLGRKPYSLLPEYCRGFDVGIIPFHVSPLTLRANPIKLREYLAAGLPVVSTPLPEVARYEGLARLASGSSAFIAEIEAALAERSDEMTRRRVAAVHGQEWETKVDQMSALIAERDRRVRRDADVRLVLGEGELW